MLVELDAALSFDVRKYLLHLKWKSTYLLGKLQSTKELTEYRGVECKVALVIQVL